MRYATLCSGIESPSVAWSPMGWKAEFFSEIEAFPSAVLAAHYPNVPNFGDMTDYEKWPKRSVDLICAGTPCQSYSIAGLRRGLSDPRGSLMLTFGAVVSKYRPRWIVWENVPGVLSSNDGWDFGSFLGMLAECGYGFAYRVLDAQYIRVASFPRTVPQRRRRVFVIGYIGDWRPAAAVLFDRESLRWNSAPRREAGKNPSPTLASRTKAGGGLGTDFDCDGGLIYAPPVSGAIQCRDLKGPSSQGYGNGAPIIAHSLRGEGFDASEDGTGRGIPLIPVGFNSRQETVCTGPLSGALDSSLPQAQAVAGGPLFSVRRLTPRECERLQGFPDDYTKIIYRGKPAADGPRYKSLGNSMAVNAMTWLGERIRLVNNILGLME